MVLGRQLFRDALGRRAESRLVAIGGVVLDDAAPAVRAFLSALLRRDFPAVLRTLAFAACRRCFSAERMLAINFSSYLVSTPSCFNRSFASADSRDLGYS